MPTKLQSYAQMAEHTAERIAGSFQQWTGFLTTAARLYKYPFPEQLMIYAQRPDATACAEFDFWNSRLGRYVRRGSRGIALIDDQGDRPRLRYVFDVADTGGERSPYLWQYRQEEHEAVVTAALEDAYGVTGADGLAAQLEQVAAQLAGEYWEDNRRAILGIVDGSFLEDYDEDNVGAAFRSAAAVSIAYTLMARCGLDPGDYFEHEDFLSVFDFNTPAVVTALGTAISQSSQQVLRQIEVVIKHEERERRQQHERADLHEERGLSDSQPDAGDGGGDGDEAAGQVREDAEKVPEGVSGGPLQPPAAVRGADGAPDGDRRDGAQPSGADDAGAGGVGGGDGGIESPRPDALGGADEHLQGPGGGNPAGGAGVQLTPQTPEADANGGQRADEPPVVQLSLFLTEQEQRQTIAAAESVKTPSAFALSQAEIDHALRGGSGYGGGRLRIYGLYQHSPEPREAIRFLKEEYGTYGHSHTFLDGTSGFVEFSPSGGVKISADRFTRSMRLTWNAVEKRLRDLARADGYLTPEEKAQYAELEREYAGVGGVPMPIARFGFSKPQAAEQAAPVQNTAEQAAPVREEYITEILRYEDGAQWAAEKIRGFFQNHPEENARISYLKLRFGSVYTMFFATDGQQIGFHGDADGLEVWEGNYLTANAKNRLTWPEVCARMETALELAEVLATEQPPVAPVPPAPAVQPPSAPAVQPPPAPADPQAVIDDALREWNGSIESKRAVVRRMADHARDKDTAAFLRAEYGDELPAFPVTGAGVTQDIPWPKVQRRIAQLIRADNFYTEAERERMDDVDPIAIRETLAQRGIVDGQLVDPEALDRDPFIQQVTRDAARATQGQAAPVDAADPPAGPKATVRELYDRFLPIVTRRVLADAPYQNACKNSDRENAYLEGGAAIRRAVDAIGDMDLMRLYFDLTAFHNDLHRQVLDETYPVLAQASPVAEQEPPATERGEDSSIIQQDHSNAYQLLDRLRADCDYFLGAGQGAEKHLWAGSVQAQISKMRELYDALPEKPEWLTAQDIDAYERQMAGLAPPAPERDPDAPPYKVGDTVYLEDTAYRITGVTDWNVELIDPTMLYPIFRAESRFNFERLLHQDARNGPITEFLPADLDLTDTDLQDALVGDGGLLEQRDKEIVAGWLRSGEGNTRVAQRLSETYAGTAETMTLLTGEEADYFATTTGFELDIQDKYDTKRTFSWSEVAPVLRAMYQQERDGFSHEPVLKEPVALEGRPAYQVEETSDAFDEPYIIRDTVTGEYYDIDDVYQTFESEEEAQAFAARLNSGDVPEPSTRLNGTPAYRVGDKVTIPYPDRDITGTVGYIGEKDVRIDTGPYAWSHESVNREQFEDGLRHDARNAALFTPEEPAPASENFRITDDALGAGNLKAKFRYNVEAIRTLKQIEAEGRSATPDEQEVLSWYVGWGGIPQAFDQDNAPWAEEYTKLKDLLTPEEYASARASTLNAHYTSPTIIRAVYEALGKLGFQSGNILEPSCGVGNFFGLLPEEMQESRLYGVELDSISGRIAQQLYPKAQIAVRGFEKTNFPDGFFDVAIGNVPFGGYKVVDSRYDKQNLLIHDYFIIKSIDKVRPGGIVAFLTSNGVSGGTMDKKDRHVRELMAERCDLLGAIRLPNNAFRTNAGTETTTDLIILQKLDAPRSLGAEPPEWVLTDTLLEQDHTNDKGETRHNFVTVNRYFQQHPEMVLGELKIVAGPYGPTLTCQPLPDADLAQQLREAVSHIHGQITEAELPELGENEEIGASIPADPNVKNYSYTVMDGEVYFRENSIMVKPALNATARERVKGMVALRDCMQDLINDQLNNCDDATLARHQDRLNRLYDAFTDKFGLINSRGNALAFADDSSYYLLCSLETLDDDGALMGKADIFSRRTIKRHEAVTSVDTASEALAVSIGEKARVDMPYMAQLSGKTEDELAAELRGVIFRLPDIAEPCFVTADEYLSGNIREKLEIARIEAKENPALFQINVEALEQVLPKDLDASEIDVRLGATWVDKKYIQQFMYETFQTPSYLRDEIRVNFSKFTAEWNISGKNRVQWNDVAAYTTFGTERASAYRILEDTLNLRDVRIYDVITENGQDKRVLNSKETTLAQQKQQAIKNAFRDWLWKDPQRRQTLVRQYNDLFNSTRPREYDGRHIVLGGINPEITLREHQLNAIAHTLYGDNVLLAHVVGAGKTFEMAAAAMESKRLGLCHKSLFAVPNHLIEQWASEFMRLYPAANILVATKKDFEARNRKKFCSKIATGDYDAVIMGHSQFERIPISAERQERLLQEQIWEIEEGLEELRDNDAGRYTIKQMERTKRSLEARLEKLHDGRHKDRVVTFEQLGVDRLFIDEAHNYKNLFLYTKMRNVAGLSTADAKKSSDMLLKCRYIDEVADGRGVVFATGTPVSNSMTELYTMQRYLQHDLLGKKELTHFDNWASTFGETVTAIELAPEGTGYRARTRFARFFNLPELMAMFRECADIKTADQLKLPTPEIEYHTEVAQPTEHQQALVQELSERAAAVHAGQVDPRIDNMLKITSDGRKLGLDQRLINPMLPDDPRSKVNMCVNNIVQIWRDGQADKLTQLVFCDISTPKARAAANRERAARIAGDKTAGGAELHALDNVLDAEPDPPFSVYEDIRAKLIAQGIPAEQVAFIHDANTDARKKELFAKVRSGQVRVLMGSTFKMGAGTNVQDRLYALHDLDCPWRPGDLEQRKGRIARQGNLNKKIRIYRYVTEGTFDSYLWQTVENKQKFISQIMTSKSPVRSCEDVDETALSYAEIKALCAGNPLIKEKMDLDIDVARLRLLKADHQSQQFRLEDNLLKHFPAQIEANNGYAAGFEADMATLAQHPHPKDGFAGMVVKGDALTDKDNAGAAILEACKDVKGTDPVQIGSYRGFTMSLSVENFGHDFILTLKGQMSHRVTLGQDARGNLTRIENALADMPGRLASVRERLADLHEQVKAAKQALGKPFPQEAELQEKTARLDMLNIQLDMNSGAARRSAKSERPSVLDRLKAAPVPSAPVKKKTHEMEVR